MGSSGVGTEMEAGRDRAVVEPLAQQGQDLSFPDRQVVGLAGDPGGRFGVGRGSPKSVAQPLGVHDEPAGAGIGDQIAELPDPDVVADAAARARRGDRQQRVTLVAARENDHLRAVVAGEEPELGGRSKLELT